ncbi:MAG: MinD/ParA family protein [Halobacteriaceae archaeon]
MKVAVCGGKGGVGKSTVAFELGAALGAVVVDGDLAMADLPAGRGPDLHDVLAGRASPLEAVRKSRGVRLLPCGRTLSGARGADPAALEAAVDAVAREYGRVVVDCPAGLKADVAMGLSAADACVPVTTPARSAVTDALRTRGAAVALDAGLARVALNRCGGDPPVAAVERAFGAPCVTIPESEHLAGGVTASRPAVRTAAASSAATALDTLARGVAACFDE